MSHKELHYEIFHCFRKALMQRQSWEKEKKPEQSKLGWGGRLVINNPLLKDSEHTEDSSRIGGMPVGSIAEQEAGHTNLSRRRL